MPKALNSLTVCMITTGFPVIAGDNSGIFIKKLVDRFDEKIKLKILVPSHKENFLVFSKYEVIRAKYFFRKWENLFYSARGLPQEIKRNPLILWQLPFFIVSMMIYTLKHSRNIDIVHAHWLPMGIFGIIPKVFWKKPLIITIRGSDVCRMNSLWVDKLLAKIIFRFCDTAVVVSKSFKKQLEYQFPFLKVNYIPNGIDIMTDNQILEKTKNEIFSILYVGNLVQEKGVLDLKWAFEKLILTGYKANLTLIGNGDLREMLNKWSAEFPERIIIKGTLPHDKVLDIMRKSDVLILPSYSEGRPNVVVEAMANFLPVIGTTIEGITELIKNGNSGLLFPPGNKEVLLDLLENCIKGSQPLTEYAKNAYDWIKKESYSWQQSADAYYNLYQSLIRI